MCECVRVKLTLGPAEPSEPGKPRPPGAPCRENQAHLSFMTYYRVLSFSMKSVHVNTVSLCLQLLKILQHLTTHSVEKFKLRLTSIFLYCLKWLENNQNTIWLPKTLCGPESVSIYAICQILYQYHALFLHACLQGALYSFFESLVAYTAYVCV